MNNRVIILNAKIYTIDDCNSVKEALVIEDNKIAYVGTNEGAKAFANSTKTEDEADKDNVLDLQGKVVLPGFIDSHIHPPGTALTDLYEVSLYGLNSVEECKDAIRDFIQKNKGIDAVHGKGWSLGIFDGEEVSKGPKKEHLDEISLDIPIILRAYDGHTLWMNSKAFEKFKIDENTPCPIGGKIEINDETKEVWGTLKESATHLVKEGDYTDYQYQKAFELFQENMHKFGVTGILSLSGFEWGMQPEVYKRLIEQNKLKMRVSSGISISPEEDPIKQIDRINEIRKKFDSDYFKTTTVKFLADGVIEGATASLIEPYEAGAGKGNNYCGEFLWEQDRICAAIEKANKEGFSIHVHSVGDNATKSMLDAIEKVEGLDNDVKEDNLDNRHQNIDYRNALTHL